MTKIKRTRWRGAALKALGAVEMCLLAVLVGVLFVVESVAGFIGGRE